MLLMGAGGALRWTQHDVLRARLVALVEGIAAVREADGFAVGYAKADTNSDYNGNNQLPSYVNSWFTHGMLEAAAIEPLALELARGMNDWWNNCSYLPELFPQDGGDDHAGPEVHGYDPADGYTSTSPFAHGHLLYWLNQAGIGHSRMAVSSVGTQADVDFLSNLFREPWWLDMLAARNKSAIYARKWCGTLRASLTEVYFPLTAPPPPPPNPPTPTTTSHLKGILTTMRSAFLRRTSTCTP